MPVTDQNSYNKSDDEKRHPPIPVRTANLSTLKESKTEKKFEFMDYLIFSMSPFLSTKDKLVLLIVSFKFREMKAILNHDPDYQIKKLNRTIKTVILQRTKENLEELESIAEKLNILITTKYAVSYVPNPCFFGYGFSKSYFNTTGLRLLTEQSSHRMNFEREMERLRNDLDSPELLASIDDYPRRRAIKYTQRTWVGTAIIGGGVCCIPAPMVAAWSTTFYSLGGLECAGVIAALGDCFTPQCGFDARLALDQAKIDYQTIRRLSGMEEKAHCLLEKGEWERKKFFEKEKRERKSELSSLKNEAKVSVAKLIGFFNEKPFFLRRDNEDKPLHRKFIK